MVNLFLYFFIDRPARLEPPGKMDHQQDWNHQEQWTTSKICDTQYFIKIT